MDVHPGGGQGEPVLVQSGLDPRQEIGPESPVIAPAHQARSLRVTEAASMFHTRSMGSSRMRDSPARTPRMTAWACSRGAE